jgi:protein-S-isoprenylcysteine O-methyltransferase Ste14
MSASSARLSPGFVRALALSGAVLFAASLASGVWLYVSLGHPVGSAAHARPAAVAVLANLLIFGLFALHHSLLARAGAKARLTRLIPAELERTAYVWVASLLFLLVVLAWQPVPGIIYQVDGWGRWILYAMQTAGVVLTLLAAAAINPRELTGVQQAWSYDALASGARTAAAGASTAAAGAASGSAASEPEPFVARGAYGLVRHPIYLGWFLMVWPAPLMTGGRLTFAAISSCYLLIAIPWEERSLAQQHGEAYLRYTRQVRWRVLPGLY